MSLHDERAAWLALLFGGQVKRQAAKAALQRWCLQDNRTAVELLNLPQDELRTTLGLDEAHAMAFASVLQQAHHWADQVEAIQDRSIAVVLRVDPAYPDGLAQRLSDARAPYVLFARGDLDLLSEPMIALQGSAHPTEGAALVAQQLARLLAEQDYAVVGAGEPGIDSLALSATSAAGGAALVMLGAGLDAQAPAPGLSAGLRGIRALWVSPYLPDQPRTDTTAQARLPLVAALSEALVLIEPDAPPEVWPGYSAMRAHGLQTLLWSAPGPLLDAWRASGAVAFDDAPGAWGLLTGALQTNASSAVPGAIHEATDDVPLYESPHYRDAEAALAALRRTGAVPPALARRLRAARWSDDHAAECGPSTESGGDVP